jgi:hypothetical protein
MEHTRKFIFVPPSRHVQDDAKLIKHLQSPEQQQILQRQLQQTVAPEQQQQQHEGKNLNIMHACVNFFQTDRYLMQKAEYLAKVLMNIDSLKWNNRAEILVNDVLVKNSNLTALMYFVLEDDKPEINPVGIDEFHHILKIKPKTKSSDDVKHEPKHKTNENTTSDHLHIEDSQQPVAAAARPSRTNVRQGARRKRRKNSRAKPSPEWDVETFDVPSAQNPESSIALRTRSGQYYPIPSLSKYTEEKITSKRNKREELLMDGNGFKWEKF